MDEATRTELEAAAFRRLVAHLRERSDVENIDLMELAGFCRNCLSGWYQEAAAAKGIALSKEEAREIVYGMAYEAWKAKFQTGAEAQGSQDAQARCAVVRVSALALDKRDKRARPPCGGQTSAT